MNKWFYFHFCFRQNEFRELYKVSCHIYKNIKLIRKHVTHKTYALHVTYTQTFHVTYTKCTYMYGFTFSSSSITFWMQAFYKNTSAWILLWIIITNMFSSRFWLCKNVFSYYPRVRNETRVVQFGWMHLQS